MSNLKWVIVFIQNIVFTPFVFANSTQESVTCMRKIHGTENYQWAIRTQMDVSSEFNLNQKFVEMESQYSHMSAAQNAIQEAILGTLSTTINTISLQNISTPGFNAKQQAFLIFSLFRENLVHSLKNANLQKITRIRLTITPTLSKTLRGRRDGLSRDFPFLGLYPDDRLNLLDLEPQSSAVDPLSGKAGEYYAGIVEYLRTAYECKMEKPSIASMVFNLELNPQVENSKIFAQVIASVPTEKSISFTQSNEQVEFSNIQLPRINLEQITNANGILDGSLLPVILINFQTSLQPQKETPILIEFGPLGTYQNGKWQRKPGKDFEKLVPSLRARAAGSALKNEIGIDFHVFNLTMNLENQSVTDLDLYLKIGPTRKSEIRYGRINRPDIDLKFQNQINQAIADEISKQKNKISAQLGALKAGQLSVEQKSMIENSLQKMGSEAGIPGDFIQVFIESLFTGMAEGGAK